MDPSTLPADAIVIVTEVASGEVFMKSVLYGSYHVKLLLVPAITSAVSAASAVCLVGWMAISVVFPGRADSDRRARSEAIRGFLRKDLGIAFLLMLLADLWGVIGLLVNFAWAVSAKTEMGPACILQAVSTVYSTIAVALANLLLCKATADIMIFGRRPALLERILFFAFAALFPIFLTGLGPAINPSPFSFYGPRGPVCYITFGARHQKEFSLLISWMIVVSLAVMVVFYGLVFIYIRKKAFNFNGGRSGGVGGPSQVSSNHDDLRKVARRMLWFPLAYAVWTLPMEITTMYTTFGNQVSHEVLVFAETVISLLALSDVVIFLLTRKSLLFVRGQSSMILSSRAPEDQKHLDPALSTDVLIMHPLHPSPSPSVSMDASETQHRRHFDIDQKRAPAA